MSKRGNKNDNRSVEEEDDDDEDIPEEYLHNTQDNSERLRIRKGYRTLIEDLHSWLICGEIRQISFVGPFSPCITVHWILIMGYFRLQSVRRLG
jgi:hypothetical protein